MKRTNFYYLTLLLLSLTLFSCSDDDTTVIVIPDDEPEYGDSDAPCFVTTDENNLDVLTWNIEHFSAEQTDIEKLKELIKEISPDVMVGIEIMNVEDFMAIGDDLDGYEAIVEDVPYSLNFGFLFKTSEITEISSTSRIETINTRPGVQVTVKHKNGLEATVIALHLKCCSDGVDKRSEASYYLKEHIDNNLANKNVIVVGDYNGEILERSEFSNIINDSTNYKFTDMEIAKGNPANWSYPSWPSHLDHILITNELFDNFNQVNVLAIDNCYPDYEKNISDHRPLIASFKAD